MSLEIHDVARIKGLLRVPVHNIVGLHVTSRRPCRWSRARAFLSRVFGLRPNTCRPAADQSKIPVARKKKPLVPRVLLWELNYIFMYHIYSINRPGRISNFWTLRVSPYSRLGAY